jgi:uncharacterized protein CbrC (UPF0167 family)
MTAEQLIKEVQENASEWLEMCTDPAAMVAGILANKVIQLQQHIEYLQKRLDYDAQHNSNASINAR